MASKPAKRSTPKFKFQVVLEAIRSQRSDAEVARAYQVHPITLCKWKKEILCKWKKEFLEKGAEVFAGKESAQQYEKTIAKLERMLGKKEVELALLKNFWDES